MQVIEPRNDVINALMCAGVCALFCVGDAALPIVDAVGATAGSFQYM